ncbi:MAG: porin family protein [Chitinophagaceae bacterium]|nr:porin family protein [Chitinophagaceae bacterium]
MSENLHNIDDLFKKAIDEHEDTPSAKVWDAIDKNLDKKKVVSISRKYNKLKWAAAALLLFSFGMGMYVWQTRMTNRELVKENKINKATKTNKQALNNVDKKFTTPETTTTQIEKNSKQPADKQTNSPAVQTVANTAKTKNQQETSQQKIILQHTQKTQPNVIAYQNKKRSNEADRDSNEQQIKNKETVSIEKEGERDNNIIPEKYTAGVPMIFRKQPNLYSMMQIQFADPFSNSLHFLFAPAENITEKNKNTSLRNKTSKSTKASPFSATVFFSPEFVSSTVKGDHPRYREDNRNEIKNNEKINPSSSYGVLLDYGIGNNWKLQSGIAVSTRVTDIHTKTIYARPDNGGNVNYRLSCSAGSAFVPLKSGANPVQGDSTKILSAKNILQYVSIPLSIKYSIGKGKFNVVPGVGIAANILSKGKVETVIVTGSGNESSSTSNIEGLKSNYLSSQISLGAEYHLGKKIALNFTPTARLALSSINKDAAVKTKLNSFGLSAGITFRL